MEKSFDFGARKFREFPMLELKILVESSLFGGREVCANLWDIQPSQQHE